MFGLYETTQRRTAEQAALLEASHAISSTLDLPTMLQRLAEQMGRAIDVTSIYIYEWNQPPAWRQCWPNITGCMQPQERISDLGQSYRLAQDMGLTPEGWEIRSPS